MNKTKLVCAYYEQNICRSCTELSIPYPEQITFKENQLKALLHFLPEFTLLPTQRSKLSEFRNRVKMSVTGTVARPIIGILGKRGAFTGQELLHCPIHHPRLNTLLQIIPGWIKSGNLIPYDVDSQRGELKGLILFYSEGSGEMYLRFVLRSKECVARIRKLVPEMQKEFPDLQCISANLQPVPHAILEGSEEFVLSSRDSIVHAIGDLRMALSPQAFVQTHGTLARALYQTAAEWIRDLKVKKFLELFSGQGAFSFFAAPFIDAGLGIEMNPEAVATANRSAREFGFAHLRFSVADVNQALPSQNPLGETIQNFNPDCMLVNPPRRGLGPEGVQHLIAQKPNHLLYSSCSAESLAKDLHLLAPHYQLARAQIFDFFPHTLHFETLALLTRK